MNSLSVLQSGLKEQKTVLMRIIEDAEAFEITESRLTARLKGRVEQIEIILASIDALTTLPQVSESDDLPF